MNLPTSPEVSELVICIFCRAMIISTVPNNNAKVGSVCKFVKGFKNRYGDAFQ